MKKLLIIGLLAVSCSVFAKGSSHPKKEEASMVVPQGLPCWVQVSDTSWVNAKMVTSVHLARNYWNPKTREWSATAVEYFQGKQATVATTENHQHSISAVKAFIDASAQCK